MLFEYFLLRIDLKLGIWLKNFILYFILFLLSYFLFLNLIYKNVAIVRQIQSEVILAFFESSFNWLNLNFIDATGWLACFFNSKTNIKNVFEMKET